MHMRLFQNSGIYPSYQPRLNRLTQDCRTFDEMMRAFLADRFGAAHFLKPVLDANSEAFFTNGDHESVQRLWAVEQGLAATAPLDDILLAQIEHHRTDVFYNLDPMRYGDRFLARLPGCVRKTIAWRAAPSAGGQFINYDLLVCNFPSIAESFRQQGARVAHFSPAHDPVMDVYAANDDRPIDVLFVGTYSRHHLRRAKLLETLASLGDEFRIALHLDTSRFTNLADSPLGWVGPLGKYRRPAAIRRVARPPVFGRSLLEALSRAKIVMNGAIDMSGNERGNMRVWEALGCGAAMLSDHGTYPDPMQVGRDFMTYVDSGDAISLARHLLLNDRERRRLAQRGYQMIRTSFSKDQQWTDFQNLAG